MVAEVRERLLVSKPETQMFDMEIFNSKKPNDFEVKSIRLKFRRDLQVWKI
jgi:hypothetical protein